ncbi:MAG: hypothetical protein QM639_00070 [Rhodocyclaceae bacterium]
MHPIHDADPLLLLAITLASKRKPAAVEDIAIALGTLQPHLPAEDKLLGAFARLSSHGLIVAGGDSYGLSAAGEALMKSVPAKGETADRAAQVKRALLTYEAEPANAAVQPEAAALSAALEAWRASLRPLTKSEQLAQQRQTRTDGEWTPRKAEGWRPSRPGSPRRSAGPARATSGGFGSPKRGARGR